VFFFLIGSFGIYACEYEKHYGHKWLYQEVILAIYHTVVSNNSTKEINQLFNKEG
jgi:hypothetical protein